MKTENIERCISVAKQDCWNELVMDAGRELAELKRLAEIGAHCEQIAPAVESANDLLAPLMVRQVEALESIAAALKGGK